MNRSEEAEALEEIWSQETRNQLLNRTFYIMTMMLQHKQIHHNYIWAVLFIFSLLSYSTVWGPVAYIIARLSCVMYLSLSAQL